MKRFQHVYKILFLLLLSSAIIFAATRSMDNGSDTKGMTCKKSESVQDDKCGSGCRAKMQEAKQESDQGYKKMKAEQNGKCGSSCSKADEEKTCDSNCKRAGEEKKCGSGCMKQSADENSKGACKQEKMNDGNCKSASACKRGEKHQMNADKPCKK